MAVLKRCVFSDVLSKFQRNVMLLVVMTALVELVRRVGSSCFNQIFTSFSRLVRSEAEKIRKHVIFYL